MERWIYEFVTIFYFSTETGQRIDPIMSNGDQFQGLNKRSALGDLLTYTEF